MKASELRIGNYINYLGKDVSCSINTIYAVSSITADSVMYKPIELTEEWVLKLGYECIWSGQGNATHYRKKDSLVDIHTHDYKDFDFTWHYSESGKTSWEHIGHPYITIKHVHTLQNLYHSLRGEELKLKE